MQVQAIPPFFIIISVTTAVFLLYLNGARMFEPENDRDTRRTVLLTRLYGFFCYGVIPLIVVATWLQKGSLYFGLGFEYTAQMWYWLIGLAPVMIGIAYLGNRSEEGTDMYPQIRIADWKPSLVISNAASWILYLIGYEFFFRGFLLFGSLLVMDMWSAVALNAVIYALMHLQKNMRETVGSVPFGAVLAIIALQTGSIWTGVIIHCTLAIANFLFAIKLHPQFRFVK